MLYLIIGLLLFLGVHSVRILADDWRTTHLARVGEQRWKALFSLASGLGLVLIVLGYGAARTEPIVIWLPPVWTRHLASLLILPAFVLIAAAYVPGNRFKAALGHPMVFGVKLWALAHLLANGNLADLFLFGSFLVWAVLSYRAARGRDRVAGVVRTRGPISRDVLTGVIGAVAWAAFALLLHMPLIGVRPY